MAIHEDFAKYKALPGQERERALQAEVIIPLLQRLGFSVAWNNHGVDEHGRDVIFGTVDQFGELLWFGMQVKCLATIGKGEATKLIGQVRDAFTHPFQSEKPAQQGYISRLYVANAGTISDHFAKAVRLGAERQGLVGPSLRFLDGGTIAHLSKWAAYNRREFIREQLTGLLMELQINERLIPDIFAAFANRTDETARFRNDAASHFLTRPFAVRRINPDWMYHYWQAIQVANRMLDVISTPLAAPQLRANAYDNLVLVINALKEKTPFLVEKCKVALEELALPG